jgi:hypothetical protein
MSDIGIRTSLIQDQATCTTRNGRRPDWMAQDASQEAESPSLQRSKSRFDIGWGNYHGPCTQLPGFRDAKVIQKPTYPQTSMTLENHQTIHTSNWNGQINLRKHFTIRSLCQGIMKTESGRPDQYVILKYSPMDCVIVMWVSDCLLLGVVKNGPFTFPDCMTQTLGVLYR